MTSHAATTAPVSPAKAERSPLRSVAVPTEHGGWGLTAEPVVLGLAVAPSIAGACLGAAAILAFLARTPLRIVLVDRHRNRDLGRTALARRVLLFEVAAMILLAAGHPPTEALAAWMVLAGRATTAIPHVRAQIERLHHRPWSSRHLVVADVAAFALAVAAVAADRAVVAGSVAVVGVMAVQRLTATTPAPAKVIGIRQTVLGLAVVAATAVGIHLT